jgi:hypothetical protein
MCIADRINFEAADALSLPNKLIQTTPAKKHGIRHSGLEKTLKLLPNQEQYDMYFSVPSLMISSFRKQPYKTEEGNMVERLNPQWKTVQHVVKVDMRGMCAPAMLRL